MSRLQDQFSDRVDFFHLDVDKSETEQVLRQFDIRRRSTYLLIDAEGNIIKAWTGYLDQEMVAAEMEEALSKL